MLKPIENEMLTPDEVAHYTNICERSKPAKEKLRAHDAALRIEHERDLVEIEKLRKWVHTEQRASDDLREALWEAEQNNIDLFSMMDEDGAYHARAHIRDHEQLRRLTDALRNAKPALLQAAEGAEREAQETAATWAGVRRGEWNVGVEQGIQLHHSNARALRALAEEENNG